ncbi:MAG TPA: hypothetical protein VMW32_02215 [Bacteroidales bacterium]|nr:hypothetical protein [Bacteroidales bacterium]
MAQILFLTQNATDACSFYRAAGIIPDLQRKTNDTLTLAQWSQLEINWSIILQYDIIFFQRPTGKMALDLCQYIKSCNRQLWIDYDDNLLCVPPENRAHWIYDKPEVQESIKKILALADVVSVTTEDLKQSFIEWNKNIEVIPNAFNDSVFKRGILPKRSNLVVWRGTDTHVWDLMKYGKSISKATLEHPEKQFLYIGYSPWFMPVSDNQSTIEEMDLIKYFGFVYKMAPLVVHVPLVDELFNRCKSNIAALEGSYFGAACVVPDFWDIPGTLKYKTEDDYYNALKDLLSGQADREILNKIAWEYIQDTLTLSKINVLRLNLINSLI